MRVGIDDTDSPAGGCTTHFALEAAAALRREHGLVLRRLPQLVRLNPNVPWKTRGNAAVALELGGPSGGPVEVVGASAGGLEIRVDPAASPVVPGPAHEATMRALVERWCDLGAPGTDPAVVFAGAALPASLYLQALTDVVEPDFVRAALDARGARYFALGDGRGIVGAAAAAAFAPREPTFEFIAYRARERWGTRRSVGWESVDGMDREFPETFNNIDRENRHVALAPSTPCPVLLGVRATSPARLAAAARAVEAGEPWAGFLLFETNQGTDGHIVEARGTALRPLTTVSLIATVATHPERLAGGHIVFQAADDGAASFSCAAFEPTKQFRDVVGQLVPGDRIRAVGAWRIEQRTVNLEKIEVIELARSSGSRVAQACQACGASLKSAGRKGPLRCRRCGASAPRQPAVASPRAIRRGWYEVPISARRHLAKPIDPHGLGSVAPNIETAS